MTTLLDYSEYKSSSDFCDSGWRSSTLDQLGDRTTCAFCFAKLATAFAPEAPWTLHEQYAAESASVTNLHVKACPYCGWWQMEVTYEHEIASGGRFVSLRSGILRTFDIAQQEAPLAALRDYVTKHPDQLRDINPTSFERLVAAVFRDFQHTEVIHTGRSHDGGVDLLLVLTDTVMPIQVKRRVNPRRGESVRTVRELFGVMFRDGYRNAAVVSSADRFSTAAKREVDQVIASGRCDRFDLVDFGQFRDLPNLTAAQTVPAWRGQLLADDSISAAIRADAAYQNYLRLTGFPVAKSHSESLF